jgi:signal peptidase II
VSALHGRRLSILVAAAIVAVDQVTKLAVDSALSLHESRTLIEGLLDLTYVRNRGAAFGLLSDADFPFQAVAFAVVSLLALALIAAYAYRLPASHRLPQLGLALIMGGAIGNLIDRARLGYVIDFVDVYWGPHHWPAFNVADSAISVGVALLILDILRSPQQERAARSEIAETAPLGRTE